MESIPLATRQNLRIFNFRPNSVRIIEDAKKRASLLGERSESERKGKSPTVREIEDLRRQYRHSGGGGGFRGEIGGEVHYFLSDRRVRIERSRDTGAPGEARRERSRNTGARDDDRRESSDNRAAGSDGFPDDDFQLWRFLSSIVYLGLDIMIMLKLLAPSN